MLPFQRTLLSSYPMVTQDTLPAANTQYKTVGGQWFASICFSNQLFQRWIRTRSENPTVSYCQTLAPMQ